MSAADGLRRLQDIDTRTAGLSIEIADLDSAIVRDAALERAREAATTAEQQRRGDEAAATAAEAELNALQQRVTSLDRRLYGGSVHNPQELLEMQRELETLRDRARDSEERAVELLDIAEQAAAREKELLSALHREEERRANELDPLSRRLAERTAQMEEAAAARDVVVHELDQKSVALYARVAQRHSPAVVGMAGDSCGGCHLPLSNEERRLVRTGSQIVQCSNCDRILVP
ncbi:MAG: hypothetical protein JOY80_00300 [Candidatus Dormibacteraeota bacterium]|nr:hypothetical protein [Candidatus Dormibacteraeota bacterium]